MDVNMHPCSNIFVTICSIVDVSEHTCVYACLHACMHTCVRVRSQKRGDRWPIPVGPFGDFGLERIHAGSEFEGRHLQRRLGGQGTHTACSSLSTLKDCAPRERERGKRKEGAQGDSRATCIMINKIPHVCACVCMCVAARAPGSLCTLTCLC